MDLDVWACPVCISRLSESEEGLRCAANNHTFRRHGVLPVLLQPEDEGLLRDALRYATGWKREQWSPPPEAARRLPYVRNAEWKQKARSLHELLDLLGIGGGRKVADVGAGTGWLSYRLTRAGFRCYATDISADRVVGLGAAEAFDATGYRFERAIATLSRWPFRTGSHDVAICNASLHYQADTLPVVKEAARVLRSGGVFIVLNSPVHRDSRSAKRAAAGFRARLRRRGGIGALVESLQHFVSTDLEATLRHAFPRVRRHDPDYGAWFRATRATKGWLLGMELASFPIYEARRP